MMVLQELLFPNTETCPSFEMYFRTDDGQKHAYVDPDAGVVRVPRWCRLDMDTYFNGFSIGKWRKYTRLDNLRVQLELSGEFRVELIHWQQMKSKRYREVLAEHMVRAGGRETVELAFPADLPARGICACALYAVGEDCAFHGGCYVTEVDEASLNPVDIALDICTFRREAFIERNLGLLRREIFDNPDSPLNGHFEVFISDNGRTLDIPALSDKNVHIYPNRNVGGAGGFTRGMIEIIDSPRAFSHVLLMDDDVLIGSDALLRTYRLLRMMKPEYAGKTIAGAMLRLDERWKQHECCAWWTGRFCKSGKKKIDLREIDNLLYNEREEPFDFNAWWYSCIPMSKISNDSLPMPMFVRMDDVEFGLRTGSDVLAMNGICLWHEPFEYKFASSMDYYEMRNLMMMNAIHRPGIAMRMASVQMAYRILANLVRYRYKSCALVFRGVDDFLKGADALMQRDPEALHREIMGASDKFLPLNELEIPFNERQYRKNLKKNRSTLQTIRLVLMNGLLLPPKGPAIVDAFMAPPWACYRRGALLNYNEAIDRGFVTKRSVLKSLGMMLKTLGKLCTLMRRYKPAAQSYREAYATLTSRAFWDHYLGLDDQ